MRDQLTLTNFLGSGAFGEVFEGVARNILSDQSETRVAVKVRCTYAGLGCFEDFTSHNNFSVILEAGDTESLKSKW